MTDFCKTAADDIITISGLRKTYATTPRSSSGTLVLDGFDLSVRRGEFLTLFGPNACGKSTLLHVLAGVVPVDSGAVAIDGLSPGDANVGFVFQNFQASLFPWRRNIDNVAWPLELRGLSRNARLEKTRRFLSEMNISLPEHSYPYQLSGGQQQLLSTARALIAEPRVLLMDEPFNQLDFQTRLGMQTRIADIWRRTKTTVIFVSHDIEEALLLGDRTVLLSNRPARVMEILENPLPRDRDHSALQTPVFFQLKSKALSIFMRALES